MPQDYITVPIETDPEALNSDVFGYMQGEITGWRPAAGNLEVITVEAYSRVAAEIRDLASRVPTSIFRYFGASLSDLPPTDATAATVLSTWTMVDDRGYTIPAKTVVGVEISGDVQAAFQVVTAFTVAPGDTVATGVLLQAVTPGVEGSGLGGVDVAAFLVDGYAFVTSVILEGVTGGGVDAETDTEYLNRLVAELQLMSPRPILARDAAILARNIPGVWRALALDNFFPGQNEIQRLAIIATGGTFTLTFGANTTSALAYTASAAAISTALQALASVGAGNVLVTGGPLPGTPILIQFVGSKAKTNVAAITGTSSLTGGGAGISLSTIQDGAPAATNYERAVTVIPVDEAGEPVGATVSQELDDYLQSMREQNFLFYVDNPTYYTIEVFVDLHANKGADPQSVADRVKAALATYLDPSEWGVPNTGHSSDDRSWTQQPVVRYLEVAEIINRVEGVDYIITLQMGVNGGSTSSADISMTANAPLTRMGTRTVEVDGTTY